MKFPTNFVIIDMEDEKNDELPLKRSFLSTTIARIDFRSGITIFKYRDEFSTYKICAEARHSCQGTNYKIMVKENKKMICNQMKVKTVEHHSRYLGLPVVFGRSKRDIFSFVQERVWKKLKGWKEKCLSRAGKEILIKVVAQAIPNYIMSCYKLPEGCCNELEAMLSKFWWGTTDENRKLHWMSWKNLGSAMGDWVSVVLAISIRHS